MAEDGERPWRQYRVIGRLIIVIDTQLFVIKKRNIVVKGPPGQTGWPFDIYRGRGEVFPPTSPLPL